MRIRTLAALLAAIFIGAHDAFAEVVELEYRTPSTNVDNPATPSVDESNVPLTDLERIEFEVTEQGGETFALDSQPASPTGGETKVLSIPLSELEPGTYSVVGFAVNTSGRRSEPSDPRAITLEDPQPIPGRVIILRLEIVIGADGELESATIQEQ